MVISLQLVSDLPWIRQKPQAFALADHLRCAHLLTMQIRSAVLRRSRSSKWQHNVVVGGGHFHGLLPASEDVWFADVDLEL